ncbi:MAG: hypothetical protein R2864_00225 [Syntrophotaleaceae bacterium]
MQAAAILSPKRTFPPGGPNLATIKPLDVDLVLKAARETGAVVTAEERYR